tara:strand:- start:10830 stop:12158 length:1329 start_codon:yes stop_codon:yes gene_type:complete
MAAQDKSTYEVFEIKSYDGTKTVDLSGGIVNFSYFENVLSPMVTAQALIVNTGNVVRDDDGDVSSVYNGLPINGGEKVSIKIPATGEGPGIEFTEQNDNELYVASITNVLIDAERESFTLNLVSREAITNETSRIGKKFPSSEPISDSVKEIIKNYLLSDKDVDIDETQNPYGFIGNMKKPFTTLTWLATKSVPGNVSGGSATAGYFFFETYLGYHFRSIDSLISQDPFPVEYTYSPGIVDTQDPMKDFKILDFSTMRNQKLIENLEKGAYCTYRMYFNPVDSTFTTPQQGEFKVSQYSKNMENLGRDFEILLPPVNKTKKSLGNVPSRYMTGVLDFGILEKKEAKSLKKNADPMDYHSQAMMRYNTIFTQILSATIPLNTQLTAGTIIKLNFAKITADKTKVRDDEQSGLYMIKELVHYYDNKGSFTKLKLIRDTMGKKDK